MPPVPPRGRFLGSIASVFKERHTADIHCENVWTEYGWQYRLLFFPGGWGVTGVCVEHALRAPGAPPPEHWFISGHALYQIVVDDQGQEFPDRDDIGNPLPNQQHIQATYDVNGDIHAAWSIPWHHRVTLRKAPDHTSPFHYHQHEARGKRQGTTRRLPEAEGKHWSFKKLLFGTQVQNYRKAMPE